MCKRQVARGGTGEPDLAELIAIVTEMVATSEWKASVQRNRWKENFLPGQEFEKFIAEEQTATAALLKELGLA